MSDFAENLKRMRILSNYTLQELSIKSGISEAALSLIENKKRSPSLDTAIKVSKALNVSLDEIAGLKPIEYIELIVELNELKKTIAKVKNLIWCII